MISSLLLGAAVAPNIAFTARIYYPYPDKRISYGRVYTIDWKGGKRTLHSLAGQDCGQVMWAGRNRLVYEVYNKSLQGTNSLWTVSLPTGKPTLLANGGSLRPDLLFSYGTDGEAIVELYKQQIKTVDPVSGKLKPFLPRLNAWNVPFGIEVGVGENKTLGSIESTDKLNPGSFVSISDGVGYLTTGKNEQIKEVAFSSSIHHPSTNRLWLISYDYWRAHSVSRVRWDTGKVQELFVAGRIDWRPDRDHVAFVTQQSLSPYGPVKKVWTSELWVAELESGKKRQIKMPLSFLYDVSVSPP